MIEVEMSKDIQDFTPRIIGPFSRRQIVCIAIAAAYGLPIMSVLPISDITMKITVGVALMAPVVACGWGKPFNMPLEQFIFCIFKTSFLLPKRRKYESYSEYDIEEEPEKKEKKKIIKWKKLPGRR